jgi:hypothetical protein
MVKRLMCSLPVVVAVVLLLSVGAASAAVPAAGWTIHSFATPTSFSTGDNAACELTFACDAYHVTVTNVGGRSTDGSPVTVVDTLPAGVTAQVVHFEWSRLNGNLGFLCGVVAGVVRCSFPFGAVAPGETLELTVFLTVGPGAAASLANAVSVSGGGVAEASTSTPNANGSAAASFGVNAFDALIAGPEGMPDSQAGDHPNEFNLGIYLNNGVAHTYGAAATSVEDVKDVAVDLPLGFAGSALVTPTCPEAQLSALACPPDTRVGHIQTFPGGDTEVDGPLYNVVPERGVAAEFGFNDLASGTHVLYVSVVPTPAGYVLRTTAPDIAQVALDRIAVELYGDPAERDASGNTPVAFFTDPADCSGEPLIAGIHMDSWQFPGSYNADGTPDFSDPSWAAGSSDSPAVSGCDQLRFAGSIASQPDTTQADTPSGLEFELRVPQNETPGVLGTPPVKKTVVTLPAGVALNPSAAGGLAACSPGQIALGTNLQPACPEASRIGTLEVSTPAVGGVLQGSIYLASPNENPFGSLIAFYGVVDDPTTGVLIKVPALVEPDSVTGQLRVTIDDLPQFQFSDLKVHLSGGPRAPLSTPAGCGTYTTGAELTPWSAPGSGPPTEVSDGFQITSGCADGFNPSFTAGTVNNQAGGFSPFTATFSRQDGEQNVAGVTVTTPPGVLGTLRGVERCPEPQASQGTCGANSLIGHTTVAAGTGPDPYWVQAGQVFLTGPYKGAPFGLSVVVPAVAGPFNLGNVVVRAAIDVNPHTAQITVVSDSLPRILDGVPLDVRTVNVTIDRPNFMFNPTSCEPLTVNGSLSSTQGAIASLSSRFQAANCANLPFKPVFTVNTQAKTSKQTGASLNVKYVSGAGQANTRQVAVSLPKALPARLTTIQQACTEAAFAANPASCPAGSVIGTATASTPVLPGTVTGPVYLVSHGGAAFPDVVAILQGEGVKVELVGSVDIKHGITSSTFASVPDAPISVFEMGLPQGPHSGLAANLPPKAKGSFCGQSLLMPTTITGQNGAVITQTTKIAVTGCPKTKTKTKKKTKKAKHKRTSGKRRK